MSDEIASLIIRLVTQDDASAGLKKFEQAADSAAKKADDFAKGFTGPRKKAAKEFAEEVLATGKISGEALEKFAKKVPAVKDALAKAFGGSFDDVKKLAGEGALSLDKVAEAFGGVAEAAVTTAAATGAATKVVGDGLKTIATSAATTAAEVAGIGEAGGGVAASLAAGFGVAGASVAAVSAAVIFGAKAWHDYREEQKELTAVVSTGLGRTLGITVDQLNGVAKAVSETSDISISSAKAMVAAFAGTGNRGLFENAELLSTVGKDFAKTTKTDITTATAELAKALDGDLGQAVDSLNQRFAAFDAKSTERIKSLAAQGKEAEAVKEILNGLGGALQRAEPAGIFTKATAAVSRWGDEMLESWNSAFQSETPIKRLQRLQDEAEKARVIVAGFGDTPDAVSQPSTAEARRGRRRVTPNEIARGFINDRVGQEGFEGPAQEPKSAIGLSQAIPEANSLRKAVEANNIAFGELRAAELRASEGLAQAFNTRAPETLQKKISDLKSYLSSSGGEPRFAEEGRVALARYETQLEQITKAGGSFGLQQNQQAEAFQNQVAGLRAFTDEQKAAVAQQVAFDAARNEGKSDDEALVQGQRAYQLVMEQSSRATEETTNAQKAQLAVGPQLIAAAQLEGSARAGAMAAAQAEIQLRAQHKDITTADSQAIMENARAVAMQNAAVADTAAATDYGAQAQAKIASLQAEAQAIGMSVVERARYLSLAQSTIQADMLEKQGKSELAAEVRKYAGATAEASAARAQAGENKAADNTVAVIRDQIEALDRETAALGLNAGARARIKSENESEMAARKAEYAGRQDIANAIRAEADALADSQAKHTRANQVLEERKRALKEAEQAQKAFNAAVAAEASRIGAGGFSSAGMTAGSLEDLKRIGSAGSTPQPGQTMGAEARLNTAVPLDPIIKAAADAAYGEGNYSTKVEGGFGINGGRVHAVPVPDMNRVNALNTQKAAVREQAESSALQKTLSLVASSLSRGMSDLNKQLQDAEQKADDLESQADRMDQDRQNKLQNYLSAGPSPYEQNPDLFYDPRSREIYAEKIAGNTGDLLREQAAAAREAANGIKDQISAIEEQQQQLSDMSSLLSAGVKLSQEEVNSLGTLIGVVRKDLPASIGDILTRSLQATAQATSLSLTQNKALSGGGIGVGNSPTLASPALALLGSIGVSGAASPSSPTLGVHPLGAMAEGGLVSGASPFKMLPRFAEGGMIAPEGTPRGGMLAEVADIPHFDAGGSIRPKPRTESGGPITGPGTGKSDDVLMWGSNGEFVVKEEQTRKHRRLLEIINSGQPLPPEIAGPLSPLAGREAGEIPRFADGGFIGLPRFADGGLIPMPSERITVPAAARVSTTEAAAARSDRPRDAAPPAPGGNSIGSLIVQLPKGADPATFMKTSQAQMAREVRRAGRRINLGK